MQVNFARAAFGGLAAGLVLHFVNGTLIFPVIYAYALDSAMRGMMAAMGSLVGHLLYGGLLGAITGAPEARVAHA